MVTEVAHLMTEWEVPDLAYYQFGRIAVVLIMEMETSIQPMINRYQMRYHRLLHVLENINGFGIQKMF